MISISFREVGLIPQSAPADRWLTTASGPTERAPAGEVPVRRKSRMPDGVDAPVEGDEAAGRQSTLDRIQTEAKFDQLSTGNDAVLSGGDRRNRRVHARTMQFHAHGAVNDSLAAHGTSFGPRGAPTSAPGLRKHDETPHPHCPPWGDAPIRGGATSQTPYVFVYSGPSPPSGVVSRPPLAVIAPHCTQFV